MGQLEEGELWGASQADRGQQAATCRSKQAYHLFLWIKCLIEHNHVHLFRFCLWFASVLKLQGWGIATDIYGPENQQYLLSGLLWTSLPILGLEQNPNNIMKVDVCGLPQNFTCWQSLDSGWSLNLANLATFMFINIRCYLNFCCLQCGIPTGSIFNPLSHGMISKYVSENKYPSHHFSSDLSLNTFPNIEEMENRLWKQYFDRKSIIVLVSVREKKRWEGNLRKLPLDL